MFSREKDRSETESDRGIKRGDDALALVEIPAPLSTARPRQSLMLPYKLHVKKPAEPFRTSVPCNSPYKAPAESL